MYLEKDEIKKLLNDVLDERSRIDAETHSDDHTWIRARIEEERERKEMYADIRRTVIQWSIPVLLGALIYWFQTGHWKWPV